MKKILSIIGVSAIAIASLSACASGSDLTSATDCAVTPSGAEIAKVKVTGEPGVEPTVTIPSPLTSKKTERAVITEGDGEVVEPGMQVSTNYVLYSAATGEKLDSSPDFSSEGALTFVVDDAKVLTGLAKIVQCSKVGSRVAGIVPAEDAFGDAGPNFGIGANDSLVFVFDIKSAGPAPTESPSPELTELPTPSDWTENLPTVDLSGSEPVVELPETAPPTELELQVLKAGDGAEVSQESTVTIDYQGISWNSGEIFDQSYGSNPATFPVGGVIPGFAAAMVGQKAGAQLLVVIPPKYGYGEGTINENNLVGQTLVFLIEIHSVS